jgi:3-oxoacyl-[acyl-carrier-protein] synthase II
MSDVVITAAAVRTALGTDAETTWARLQAGESAVGPVQGFDARGFGDVRAAQIWREPEGPEDDPALRILGSHGRLLDEVAREVHDAGALAALARETVGLFVATDMVDSPVEDLRAAALASRDEAGGTSLADFFGGAYRQIHPLWPLSMLNNVAVGQIAIDLDLRGDNLVLASDALAGVRALIEAARSVAAGACRAAIAAGVAGRVSPALLQRRAFQGRDGPPGEGAAAIVLERASDARARGVRPLARVRGGTTTFGAGADIDEATRRALAASSSDATCEDPAAWGVLTIDGLGDLGPATAAVRAALQLAAWSGEPGASRRAAVRVDGAGVGVLLIEEAA